MKITFVAAEPQEQEYFRAQLADHSPSFVRATEDVDADVEIVSVFIYSKVTAQFLDAHPRLQAIVTRSTTTDHIDLRECARRGVEVLNVATYGDQTVAEHTFALLLALTRRLRDILGRERHDFSYASVRGVELRGKTLGLLGLGRIGQQVVPIARGFGMNVIATDLPAKAAAAKEIGVPFVDLPELLHRSDVLSLHAALTPATYHVLNRESLAQCRRGVLIINTARGALIDTAALGEALDSGQVGGAGLDVLEDERVMRCPATDIVSREIVDHLHNSFPAMEPRDPERIRQLFQLMQSESLLARANVVFTPHIAFNSQEAIDRILSETVAHIRSYVGGRTRSVLLPPEMSPAEKKEYAAAGFR